MAKQLGDPKAKSEYIEDSAIKAVEFDEFGHNDFVEELSSLITEVNPRTNIAVFAPWGSGKSSLAELLTKKFEKRPDGIWFTTFDAFKFAQDSLSRHFITQLAQNFEVKDEELRERLYSTTNSKEFQIKESDKRDLKKLLYRFAIGIGLVLVGLSFLFAHFDDSKTHGWPDYLIAMLPTWAVLTGVATLVWKFIEMKYSYDVHTEQVSGEEQFVEQFQSVIDRVTGRGASKIVVFIDELDRCSDKEVVTTLETLKTFLDVDPCVFVVAADRQVLDKALLHEARQATPENAENPYYSAGSAYLDKIFQHQLELPPFAAPSMTAFAMTLVKGRPGIWSQMNDDQLKYFFSVLIPSHVTNPRRVKVLLNSFVTTYHLMKRRVARGDLEDSSESQVVLGDRLNEIAKLVCLRCEFPNFAAHLPSEDRLPDLILSCIGAKTLAYQVDPQSHRLAQQFVTSELHVADLLAPGSGKRLKWEPDEKLVEEEIEFEEGEETEEDHVSDNVDRAGGPEESLKSPIAVAHFQQLSRYLQKTDGVEGPRSDLIYLASESKGFAISEPDARELSTAARDRAFEAVNQVLGRLEGAELADALAFLASVATVRFGEIEGDNAVLCIFEAAAEDLELTTDSANQLVDAVGRYSTRLDDLIREANLAGALRLARISRRPYASDVRRAAALHPDAASNETVGREVIHDFELLDDEARPVAMRAYAAIARREGASERLATLTLELTDEGVGDLFDLVVPALGNFLSVTPANENDEEEAARIEREAQKSRTVITALVSGAAGEGRNTLAERLIAVSLRPSDRELRDELFGLLPDQEINSDYLAIALATELAGFETGEIEEWVKAINADSLSNPGDLREWLAQDVAFAVEEFVVDELEIDDMRQRIAPLTALASTLKIVLPSDPIHERVRHLLDALNLSSSADVEKRARIREALEALGPEVVEPEWAGTVLVDDASRALAADASGPAVSELDSEIAQLLEGIGSLANDDSLVSLREAYQGHPLLPVDDSEFGELQCVAALCARHDDFKHRFTPAVIRDAFASRGPAFSQGVSTWITGVSRTPVGVWIAVSPRSGEDLPSDIASAINTRANNMNSNQLGDLNKQAAAKTVTEPVRPEFFDSARLRKAHESVISGAFLGAIPKQPTMEHWINCYAFLSMWKPQSSSAQDKTVERFLLRSINSGPTGADLALDQIDRYSHFHPGVRERLKDALSTHISEHNRDRLKSELERIGWLKRKSTIEKIFNRG